MCPFRRFDPIHRRRSNGMRRKEQWMSFLLVLPSFLAIAVFVYGFIGWTGAVSFTEWNTLVPDWSWAGLKNYLYLFGDLRFQADLRNTLVFTVLFIVLSTGLGLFLAVMLDRRIRGRSEEHTSELQSRENLVCRLPLE